MVQQVIKTQSSGENSFTSGVDNESVPKIRNRNGKFNNSIRNLFSIAVGSQTIAASGMVLYAMGNESLASGKVFLLHYRKSTKATAFGALQQYRNWHSCELN